MKSKLIFILPSLALIGFLAIKPPAIGGDASPVIITPEKTITPAAQPNLRDFDDEGHGPNHEEYDDDDDDFKPKKDLNSAKLPPAVTSTPGVIPMPSIGGGYDDDDDEDDDDEDDDDEDDDDEDDDDEDD